jgi:UDP-glucose 4-epimerase
MKALITGGAGCIGSELAGRLLKDGHGVTVFDNLSSGKKEHIANFLKDQNFKFVMGDLLEPTQLQTVMAGVDVVFHLAANSDIKFKEGDSTDEDLKNNTIATYNLLDCMRKNNVRKIVFTSSSAVYGEAGRMPIGEDTPPRPISLYGASKTACEALIGAYCGMFDFQGWIIRFANITGKKSRKTGKTVLTDFIERLRADGRELLVLGNGKQSKSYLYMDDCVDGVITIFNKAHEKLNIYNLGPDDSVTVNDIAKIVIEEMKMKNVALKYSGGDRGWAGDVPHFLLDNKKVRQLGWAPRYTSEEAIRIATRSLLESE